MADNVTLDPGSGGATVRTLEDGSSIQWPVGVVVYATTVGTPDVLQIVTLTTGLPVQPQTGATFTVTGTGGTFPVTDSGGSLTIDNATLSITGGGVESSALRVTIASDSTGVLSVDDNGGSLTVDGTVAATQSGTWTVTGTGGTFPITDSGGSLTVDAPVGTPVFVRLSDGSSAISTLPVSLASVPSHAVTNAGTFAVQVDGAALTALQLIDDVIFTDDAAFTPGTSKVAVVGAEYDDTTPDSVDEGDAGALRMSARRELYSQIRDAAGNERGANVNSSNELLVALSSVPSHAVTNAGTFAVQAAQSGTWNITNISGTVSLPTGAATLAEQQTQTASLSVLDDWDDGSDRCRVVGAAAHDAAVAGNPVLLGAEFDDTTPDSVDEGDVGRLRISANRNLYVTLRDAAGNERGLNVDGSGNLTVNVTGTVTVGSHAVTNAGTFAVQESGGALTALQIMDDWDNAASDGASVSGDVAHDTADAGEPVKVGAKAVATLSSQTLVAANDRTNVFADLDGALITRPHCALGDIVSGVASNTDGASTEVIATAGAGVKQYLTSVTLINTSASMIYVEIKSGTTVKWRFPVPATGGVTHTFNPPLPPNAADEAWNMDASAATTTLYGSFLGFKSKV